jgi:hypothetical protein
MGSCNAAGTRWRCPKPRDAERRFPLVDIGGGYGGETLTAGLKSFCFGEGQANVRECAAHRRHCSYRTTAFWVRWLALCDVAWGRERRIEFPSLFGSPRNAATLCTIDCRLPRVSHRQSEAACHGKERD